MWFFLLLVIIGACAAAYRFRVPLLARLLGQSEDRVNRELKRRGH